MITSPARIAANRRNALKSTGPKSAEGKARSAQNALKHGLRSKSFHLDDLIDWREYKRIADGLIEDHKPRTAEELHLIDVIASTTCQGRRLFDMENQLCANRIGGKPDGYDFDRISLLSQRVSKEFCEAYDRLLELKRTKPSQQNSRHTNPLSDSKFEKQTQFNAF